MVCDKECPNVILRVALMYSTASPSWQARCLSAVIFLAAYRSRNASPDWFLKHVRSTWQSYNKKVVLRKDCRAEYSEETLENGNQAWQVYHIRPRHQINAAKRVILYWHGGGFHSRVGLLCFTSRNSCPLSPLPPLRV